MATDLLSPSASITGYLFTTVALVIASPFNALLAEKAEELITGEQVSGLEGMGAALLAVPQSIVRELAKLLYYIPMAMFVLLLSFIPGVGACRLAAAGCLDDEHTIR